MRKTHSLAVMVGVAALAIAGTMAAASASPPNQINQKVNAYNLLHLEHFGSATVSWKNVSDSPLDTDGRALVTFVPSPPDGVSYADAYTKASLHINKSVGLIKNLSYDFASGEVVGGDPRISVIFGNGDVAYLSPDLCTQPIAVSGGTWSRSDFTGSNTSNSAPCGFNVTGTTGGIYTSTATQSAWAVYAAANPTQVVSYDFVVWDYPSAGPTGTYKTDRISLGTGWMYHAYSNHADKCPTEAAC